MTVIASVAKQSSMLAVLIKMFKSEKTGSLLPFFVLLLLVYLLGTAVRYRQHVLVLDSPQHNYNGQTILSGMDGYRWLRFADGYEGGVDRLSGMPEPAKISSFQPPISRLIHMVSDGFGISKERAGSLLAVFLSSLFVFPLGYYFYLCGFSSAGIGGAVTGSLGLIYFSRTTAFRPDTDILNLFFPFSIILLIRLTERRTYLYSALAGVFALLHYYWYYHSGFVALWFVLLIFNLLMNGIRGQKFYAAIAVFAVCAGIYPLLHGFFGLYEFVFHYRVHSDAFFVTVGENSRHSFRESMSLLTDYWLFSVMGLAGSLLVFRRAYLAFPVFLLGLLMFVRGEKYGIYLAPFVGVGIGLHLQYFLKKGKISQQLIYILVFCVCVLAVRPYLGLLPQPIVSKEVFGAVKNAKIPAGADVICGWSNGFLVEYLKGVRCSADGAVQFKDDNRLTTAVITSVNIDKNSLKRLNGGKELYALMLKNDTYGTADGGFYADIKCDEYGGCADIVINPEQSVDKVFYLGNLKFMNNEQKTTLYGKISKNRRNLAVFDEKTSKSFFGRAFIIGDADIDCFQKTEHDYPYIALYKASSKCF